MFQPQPQQRLSECLQALDQVGLGGTFRADIALLGIDHRGIDNAFDERPVADLEQAIELGDDSFPLGAVTLHRVGRGKKLAGLDRQAQAG